MFLSMNWIGDFVDLSGLDKKALIQRFTLSTAEVEDVIERGADTYGVVIARILSVEEHPNSKKLHLLKVDTGTGVVDCVCGAPNVREGMKVAFAREGGCVGGNPIRRATIAGYPSCGMCCSEAELGISADHSGLMEITDDLPLGTDFKAAYAVDDIIFEVDNKSLTNRPDLWGHFGIAREFSAITGRPLRAPRTVDTAAYAALPALPVEVREPELCYRYTALAIDCVREHVSPVNMRIRLFYCGSRAINLLADLTNYVMMELGQPMHAFDRRRVPAVKVQRLPAARTFRTLDEVERTVDENTLMICSGDNPVAIAGIMGGLDSEITDDTDSLLLESATFNGVSVRKSSTRLGLRTDASMRYEKMLDPELAKTATERFLALLTEIDPGVRVTSSFTDIYPTPYPTITLELTEAYVLRYAGIPISTERIVSTLRSLGFTVTPHGDAFTVQVPSWRATKDVTLKADLIEEITRIYGYDNFAVNTALSPLHPVCKERTHTDDARTKDLLVNRFSLHEVHSYIWSDTAKDKELGIDTPRNVRLLNAQTPEHASLRVSMIPSLMAFVNENKGFAERYGLFEIGRTVKGLTAEGMCNERKMLGVVLYDRTTGEESAFLQVRAMVATLCANIKHTDPTFVRVEPTFNWQHPKNTFAVVLDGVTIGFLCVLHPTVLGKLDRKAAVAVAELDMGLFSAAVPAALTYREPSRFPAIDIDLSFTASLAELSFKELQKTAREAAGELLTDVRTVDIFENEQGASLTLRCTFSSPERTLSKAELQPLTEAIAAALAPCGLVWKTL